MGLSKVERERITDSQMKLQSAARTLKHIDPRKVENFEGIQECLEDADESLRKSLNTADDTVGKN